MKYKIELDAYWSQIIPGDAAWPGAGGLDAACDQTANCAYLYGGISSKAPNNGLYRFDFDIEHIEKIRDLDIPDRLNHRMFYLGKDRFCILGGALISESQVPYIELYIFDSEGHALNHIVTDIPFRSQFGAAYDGKHALYLYSGLGRSDFFSIDVDTGKTAIIEMEQNESRAGMVMAYIGNDQLFIFSGFSKQQSRAICHNDIQIINTNTFKVSGRELDEPFGRTFAKCVVLEKQHKALIFGGTPNGMELSGSLYFYDYRDDLFNITSLQPLPGERAEPAMCFSEKNNKVYIIGGLKAGPKSYTSFHDIMVLDLNAAPSEIWSRIRE